MKLSKTFIAVTAALSFSLFSLTAQSKSIDSQLNSMFNSMSNTTSPGVYNSMTRQGITGGGFSARNRLYTLNPVNIQLPSASGGCGGIDLFAGSLSFVNAKEFTNLLKALPGSIAGIAFHLALNAIDPALDSLVSQMQGIIQKINELTANSCELAKGIVIDSASAFGQKVKADVASDLSSQGISDQLKAYWGSFTNNKESTVQKSESGKSQECKDYGALLPCALNGKTGTPLGSIFPNGNEREQKDLLMTMTGMVVVSKITPSKDGKEAIDMVLTKTRIPASEILKAMVEGDPHFKLYDCKDAACSKIGEKEVSFEGLQKNMLKFFKDGDILNKMKNGDGALSDAELKKLTSFNIENAMNYTQTLLSFNDGVNLAKTYLEKVSRPIAMRVAGGLLSDLLIAGNQSLICKSDNETPIMNHCKKQQDLMNDARRDLDAAIRAETLGPGSDITAIFNGIYTAANSGKISAEDASGSGQPVK